MKIPTTPTLFTFIVLSCFFVIAISHNPAEAEKNEFLTLHNAVRKRMKLPLLVWNETLAHFARDYANQRRGDCNMVHSGAPYGENIFWGGGNEWKPRNAVKAWVREQKWYNKKTNKCVPGKVCGHYTQVVWRDTTQLGCAFVECNCGDVFATCNYWPRGNCVDQLPFVHYP